MEKVLNTFRNAQIIRIYQIDEYWQIITEKGSINIYNPVKYCTSDNKCHELRELQNNTQKHNIVEIMYKQHNYLSFIIDNRSTITVSLRDNDYKGPEAFYIHLDTGEIIVG